MISRCKVHFLIQSGKGAVDKNGGLGAGAIAGIVVGCIVVIALIAGGGYYYVTKSNVRKPRPVREPSPRVGTDM